MQRLREEAGEGQGGEVMIDFYNQLKDRITADYERKLTALDVVFGLEKPSIPEKRRLKITTSKPQNDDGESSDNSNPPAVDELKGGLCWVSGCGKKLRSDSRRCAKCERRICSKHWSLKNKSCRECAGKDQ